MRSVGFSAPRRYTRSMSSEQGGRYSRRALVQGGLIVLATGAFARVAQGQQKIAQNLVQYQQKPKGPQECDNCLHFEAPDSCKVVAGKINPKGWCALYAPKPK